MALQLQLQLQNFSSFHVAELPSETMASVNFPPDIITEILSRLQVKPLLRFRCVSKPWCSLIDSDEFVKKHLKQSIATKTNLNLILEFRASYCSVSLDSLYPNGVVVSVDNVDGLAPPPVVDNVEYLAPGSIFMNSCNGLFLIRIQNRVSQLYIYIWNPFTRKYREIPVPPVDCPVRFEHMKKSLILNEKYAFAYVSETSEYKIVRVTEFAKSDGSWLGSWMFSEAKMFSLTSNVWEGIQDFPYSISCGRVWGAHLNGILHTVVNNGSSAWSIMGFDVRSKKHAMVPKLDLDVSERFDITVDVLEGGLSLINKVFGDKVDVWVMKEYGVKDSWVKLLSVSLKPPGFFRDTFSLKPLAYSKDGEDVLLSLNGKRLCWYNLRTQTEREVTVNMASDFYTGLCYESFASFPGFISVGNAKDDLKKDCKEKRDLPFGGSRQHLL